MTDRIPLDITVSSQLAVGDLRLVDLEAMRLVLRGGSVINWQRQSFRTADAVRQFLAVNGYDVSESESDARLRSILRAAADYIHRTYHYRFPPELVQPEHVEDIFLRASSSDAHQKLACMLLKVAHVINHIEGYELRHWLPISDQALFGLAEHRIDSAVERMRAAGLRITEYQASRKTRDSLITKLLSKKRTIAAQIFDKLRFRLITKTREDLVPLMCWLTREVLPFNYVIPGESRNDILDLGDVASAHPELGRRMGLHLDLASRDTHRAVASIPSPSPPNPFSADGYQVINFVVDMPLRVDSLLDDIGPAAPKHLGKVVFVLIEFQLLDEDTFERNERGPANHALYKRRQRQTVLKRLVWGTRVPGRDGTLGPTVPSAAPPLPPSADDELT